MILHSLSLMLTGLGPALGNHLWQSTLFAGVIMLLSLALRKYQARWRYWLWLTASAKFLIPFSLLVGMGSHFTWAVRSPGSTPSMYVALNEMGQPFTNTTVLGTSMQPLVVQSLVPHHQTGILPALLAIAWLCGFVAVLAFWYMQWRRINTVVRAAKPLDEGREVMMLRRMEQIVKLPRRIEMLLSQDAMEPGIFGIVRPVLLWPEGISRHLDDAQLEAVIAHEVWHVQRRDNLTCVMHMLVEALFWFHPLVWWLETRLVDERERACDEEVIRIGKQPEVYAESILKVCEFCVESPLSCVSGITGADLKKRIVQIMTERVARNLDFNKKLLLVAAALLAVCVPIVFGQVVAKQSTAPATAASAEHAPGDITGIWQGTLQAGQGLRTLLKISKDDGKLKAVMYSIDQGGQPIPVTSISIEGSSVNFSIKPLDVTYVGTLNPEGNAIAGNATQNGQTHVLNLQHVTAEAAWAIPEPPKPMAADATPKFDVVTVKPSDPNRPGKLFTIRGRHVMTINTNLNDLITFAYGLHAKQLIGAPEWFGTDKFDLDGVPDTVGQPNSKQMKLLIQSALTERFKLTFHHDQKELSVYALTVAKGGPKLTETIHKPSDPVNFMFRKLGALMVTNATMKDFCDGMQGAVMDRPVVDHTGLTARYDFTLDWTPDESQFAAMGARITPPTTEDPNAPPGLYTALQQQLGLKLDPAKANADVFVIDHVEKPAAN